MIHTPFRKSRLFLLFLKIEQTPFQKLPTMLMKYQMLWQKYFNNTNIAARKNIKLHIQHVPKQYREYLTEKKADL